MGAMIDEDDKDDDISAVVLVTDERGWGEYRAHTSTFGGMTRGTTEVGDKDCQSMNLSLKTSGS